MQSLPRYALLLWILTLVASETTVSDQLKQQQREGCIWLFKQYVTSHAEEIETMTQSLDEKEAKVFMDRLLIQAVTKCQRHRSAEVVQEFVDSYREKSEIYSLEMLNQIDQNNLGLEKQFTQEQMQLLEVAEAIFVTQQEEDSFILFGFDIQKFPKTVKPYYLVVYALIVGFALYHGLKDITPPAPKTD